MPAGLSRADTRLLWGALLLVVVLAGASVFFGPALEGEESTVPSSYAGDTGGALAAYLLLGDLGFDARRWVESPTSLPEDASNSVLILAEPTDGPSPAERAAIQKFVTSGGRILFCGRNLEFFFDLKAPPVAELWDRYGAMLPGPLTAGAPSIDMRKTASGGKLEAPQVGLYGPADDPVVVAVPMGEGELIWWAGPGPLTNSGIQRASNLWLFLNAMRDAEGRKLAVYWDEYFHGERGSLWSYVERTPVAWGLVQLGLLLVAVVFTYSRRSGPIVEPAPVSRQSPLEFVDTMGSLYRRSRAASIPVETAYRQLRLALAQRLSMPVTASDAELARAAAERLQLDEGLGAALDAARGANPPRKQALELVQTLMRYALKLKENR